MKANANIVQETLAATQAITQAAADRDRAEHNNVMIEMMAAVRERSDKAGRKVRLGCSYFTAAGSSGDPGCRKLPGSNSAVGSQAVRATHKPTAQCRSKSVGAKPSVAAALALVSVAEDVGPCCDCLLQQPRLAPQWVVRLLVTVVVVAVVMVLVIILTTTKSGKEMTIMTETAISRRNNCPSTGTTALMATATRRRLQAGLVLLAPVRRQLPRKYAIFTSLTM